MLQELINKLNAAMQSIQSLQIQPTEHNCTKVCSALQSIREAAQIGAEMERQMTELKKAQTEPAQIGAEMERQMTELKKAQTEPASEENASEENADG